LKTNPKLAGPLLGRGMAKVRKGEVAGGNADTAAAKEINPKIAESFAGYNVPTLRAETPAPAVAPPAVASPVTATSARPEPAAPAVEITTSVTQPARSGAAPSAPVAAPVAVPAAAVAVPVATAVPMATVAAPAPPPAADCSLAETHWKSVESIGTLAAYQDHLARFPNCVFSTLATARIEALRK
jgi:hypothetical protein